jgi:hypothetical protein
MMSQRTEQCARCMKDLAPSDEVIQGYQQMDASAFGDDVRRWMDGQPAITHPNHWPPTMDRWREAYRGPLSGLI